MAVSLFVTTMVEEELSYESLPSNAGLGVSPIRILILAFWLKFSGPHAGRWISE